MDVFATHVKANEIVVVINSFSRLIFRGSFSSPLSDETHHSVYSQKGESDFYKYILYKDYLPLWMLNNSNFHYKIA